MKELDLGKEKISKLLFAFSIPCIISMLINSLYNIVDQIFIGQGVGYLGNAATNVIFPVVIICTSLALLIGNGCAANLSLRLGEGKHKEASKAVGSSITILFILSIFFSILGYIFLPTLVNFFGCTESVFSYAMAYGKIIIIGAPFMIIYTGLAAIIRADGSPKYSMNLLVIGAIINIFLDALFILVFKWGVAGGALATVIGQIVSCIMALAYLPKMKSFKLKKEDFIPNKSVLKIMGYGVSSFVTQMTILVLFIFMNNIMTKYGADSKYGADIPLSVYGIISKVTGLYISAVLGVAIGAQPIIGFNYGAGNFDRVKEVLKKVILINFSIGLVFNLAFIIFPSQILSIFGSSDNALYIEFATKFCRTFLLLCVLNAFEISTSIIVQSLGNVKKAIAVSFTRQIILFIPIALILTHFIGLYGSLYAGPIADFICFFVVLFIFSTEYKKIGKKVVMPENEINYEVTNKVKLNQKVVITINREYGSGGRYVGELLAESLDINFYDRELINLISKETGLSENYIETTEQRKSNIGNYEYNNDDKLFIAESNIIKELAAKESCVIVGRCADYVLKDYSNTLNIFLYSNNNDKIARAVKYYKLKPNDALKKITKINKAREKYYKYYTDKDWKNLSNYDLSINVDYLGVAKTVEVIEEAISKKFI